MATYADMQNRIGDELGRAELIVGGASVARTKTAILDAIKGWKNYRFRFNELSTTLTTVAGTTDYTTATGLTDGIIEIDEMTIVYSGSRCRLDEVTASEYADMNASNPATRGVPSYYTWYGDTLRLYPAPNAVYTITMYYHGEILPVLSSDSDTNAWTNQGETLIRNTAKADLCANVLRDPQAAQLAQAAAELSFKSLRREYDARSLTGRIDPHD